jgi:hypothetical protein
MRATASPPFLETVFANAAQRHELLRQGRKNVGAVFIVALVPYALLRGLVTRLARRRSAVTPTDNRSGGQGRLGEDQQQERKED